VIPDDAPPRCVANTRYYRRRVKSPEWWRSLSPERKLAELQRITRRLRSWVWVVNLYLVVLLLCVVALAGFFVDPSVASVLSGAALLVLLLLAIGCVVWVRRRARRSLRRGQEYVLALKASIAASSPPP